MSTLTSSGVKLDVACPFKFSLMIGSSEKENKQEVYIPVKCSALSLINKDLRLLNHMLKD